MKRITAVIILLMLLTACGKSEFGVTENTGKCMTITAVNADKDDFFIIGSLEVAEGEEITAAADLTKGSIRVEIFKWADEQNADKLPTADKDAETIITANLRSTESVSGLFSRDIIRLKPSALRRRPAPSGSKRSRPLFRIISARSLPEKIHGAILFR